RVREFPVAVDRALRHRSRNLAEKVSRYEWSRGLRSARLARYLERRSRHCHHPRRAERRRTCRAARCRLSRRVRGAGLTGLGGLLMHHTFVIGETEYEAWLSRSGAGYVLHLGDKAIPVAIANGEGGWQMLRSGAELLRVLIAPDADVVHIHFDGTAFTIR